MNLLRHFNNLRIRNKLLVSYSVVFILAVTLGGISIYSFVAKGIEANIESELENSTATILNMVRTSASVSIKNHLRAITEKNRDIAVHFYSQYKEGILSEEEAKARTREVMLSQTIGKTGYIFVWDIRNAPNSIIVPVHPKEMEGKDVAHVDFAQKAAKSRNGYIEYEWKNPGEDKARKKSMYLAYFEPWQWVVAASSYREEFYELVNVDDFRDSILSLQFGKTGYTYILDSRGNIVIHPKLKGNVYDVTDAKGWTFVRDICEQKRGKIIYSWKNPDEEAFRKKLVIFNHIPEYDWIVASTGYLEEFYAPLKSVRNIIITTVLAILLLVFSISFWISLSITRPLGELMERFTSGAAGDLSVRMERQSQDEVGRLARYFNNFMERLEASNTNLKAEIRERKQAEGALKNSKEKYKLLYDESRRAEEIYRSLIHSSADAIIIYDLGEKVRYISPAFTKIFGWTMEEVGGKRIPFIPETIGESCATIIEDVLKDGIPRHSFESKRLTKDGRVLDVSISASRYNDHEGKPTGLLAILRDTTQTKKLQEQLQQARKIESIGTLAGGIAHDFNNLLMAIQGNVSLMQIKTDADHPNYQKLRNVMDLVESGAELTRQLLGFARGGKYEVKPTNLNEMLKKSSEMFGRTKKEIKLHEEYREDLWTTEVDRGQIEQVLLNIYVNASNAMPGGGDLYLRTENVVLDEQFVKPYEMEPGRYVQVSVTDTGVGMDEATKERIFEPFFTTKGMGRGRGTGLGLASVYGIIKNHNGIINVYSEKGEGTTFNLYLPASEAEVAEEEKVEVELLKGDETILLVDDEEFIRNVGTGLLNEMGYKVITAESGKDAIEVYKANRENIDMIILDMIMPDMGGGEAYNALREMNPDVKVLLASGYSVNGQASKILERGCDGFIQKPFNMERLSQKIREILDNK
ncbi:MAG: cache domain-containing protein [Proteobacteria bacterium]|nr:cache domain-containing protein [Pseudomonadota bacterium]